MPSGQFCNINFGCDQKPFNDVRVRQALALTVDREAMVGFVAEGYGTPGNDTPLNSAYHFYNEAAAEEARHRPRQEAAGRSGLSRRPRSDADRIGQAGHAHAARRRLREMAKPAGFTINVQTMPHATYLDQVWKKGPFYVGFYNMQPTADGDLQRCSTPPTRPGTRRAGTTPPSTSWSPSARAPSTRRKRRELYAKAQELMNDEVPSIIPVFFDLLAAQRDLGRGLQAASARRGVPPRLGLAGRRRAEARLTAGAGRCRRACLVQAGC